MAPRDPSSCRGWIAFRVGPHFSRPSARRGLRRQERDALSGAYLSPQCCNAVRSSEGAKAVSGHGGTCPPLRCYRARGRMGARVMASGMPGASRRAVLGGATYSVVKVWVRLRGAARPEAASQSAPHPWRASSAGVSIRDIVPAGTASLSLRQADYLSRDRAEARARGEYSTRVLGCVKEMHRVGPRPV